MDHHVESQVIEWPITSVNDEYSYELYKGILYSNAWNFNITLWQSQVAVLKWRKNFFYSIDSHFILF